MSLRQRKTNAYPEHLAPEAPVMTASLMESIKEEAGTTRTKWWLGGSLLFALIVGLTVGLIAVPVARKGHCDTEVYACPPCKFGQSWNTHESKCVDCPEGTPVSNGLKDSKCAACSLSKVAMSNKSGCECPKGYYINGDGCLKCSDNTYADVAGLKQCKSCGKNALDYKNHETCKCLTDGRTSWKAPTEAKPDDNGC